MKHIGSLFTRYYTAWGLFLAFTAHISLISDQNTSTSIAASIAASDELPDNIEEILPDTDPRYAQAEEEYSVVFAQPDKGVDASPKLEMGPVIRTDSNSNAIVTFKAAAGNCAHYAIAPTDAAKKDKIEIQFVSNDRLPDNRKWENKKETEIFKFPFTKAITTQYNDSGYGTTHGSFAARDTNHNWGFRLYKDGALLTKQADYKKYVRHMVASNPEIDRIASNISSQEAELLIKWGLVDKAFKEQVLDPLRAVSDLAASQAGAQMSIEVGLFIAYHFGGAILKTIALLQTGLGIGAAFGLLALVSKIAGKKAACDAKKSSHQSTDLRDLVILVR